MRLAFFLVLVLVLGLAAASAQVPLNQRVLVVYNSASADSLAVANYYLSQRGIPAANLCAIAPPATVTLSDAAYQQFIRLAAVFLLLRFRAMFTPHWNLPEHGGPSRGIRHSPKRDRIADPCGPASVTTVLTTQLGTTLDERAQ